MSTIGIENLRQALAQALVPSSYQGVCDAGSTTTAVVDSVGGFAADQWANYGIEFTKDTPTVLLRGVWQKIATNNGTTLTLAAALPAAPVQGDTYNIRPFGANIFDLRSVGGTAQTGADWTTFLQRLDITLSALRDAITAAAPNSRTLADLYGLLNGIPPRNIAQWGGAGLTGRDISTDLQELSAHRATTFTNIGVDVGTVSTLILAANANRRYAAIINDSDTPIYLAINAAAALNSGIRLNAGGGAYEINWTNLHGLALYGIHGSTGFKRVTAVEGA